MPNDTKSAILTLAAMLLLICSLIFNAKVTDNAVTTDLPDSGQ